MMDSKDDERIIGIEVFYTDTKGIGGKLRKNSEDFIVEEVSSPPQKDDEGEYTITQIRARNWETNRLVGKLSRKLGISKKRINFAGTKDKRAVTTQLFSIKASMENVKNLHLKDVEVLDTYTSRKGLNLGDLIGNRFEISIKELEAPATDTEKLVNETSEQLRALGGFPNFFGHQRFGALRPITHIVGRKLVEGDFHGAVLAYLGNPTEIEGKEAYEARCAVKEGADYAEALKMFPKHLGFEKAMLNHLVKNEEDYIGALASLPKNLYLMFIHAYQSYIFNKILSQRIKNGLLTCEPLIGDLVLPLDAEGLPDHKKWIDVNEGNIEKVKKRISEGKAFISGLVPGAEVSLAGGVQGEIERRVLEEEEVTPEDFIIPQMRQLSSKGMRRELISPPTEFQFEMEEDGIRMRFELTKGCYATSFLREFMKTQMLRY
ncbi:MAG: tRNA pseudouridine(13) synthase TruD [Methanomassiliicoccales archaeon]|nr:MAG: tRNA pseudouridine(13) synthase TruD [Methanomassiliicoccales archaeon]